MWFASMRVAAAVRLGRPYPYWMLKLAPAGPAKQNSPLGQGLVIGVADARTTWRTSLAESGDVIWPRNAAAFPSATTSAATPPLVGVPVEVEPSLFGTEKSECGPYDVSDERERNVLLLSTKAQKASLLFGAGGQVAPLRVEWSPVSELPGHTLA